MNTLSTALMLSGAVALGGPRPAGRLGTGATRRRPLWPLVIAVAAVVGVAAADRVGVVASLSAVAMTAARVLQTRREAAAAGHRAAATAAFLGHLVTNLRAGSSLADATDRAAGHLPPSTPAGLRRDIRRGVAAARSGGSPDRVLGQAESPELREVGALWQLATTRGLPVAELLSRARDRIDNAQRHKAATRAALAGPQATAVVLATLPLAGVAMGTAMGANPLGVLLGDAFGGWLLLAGTVLVCVGFLTSEYIIGRAAA